MTTGDAPRRDGPVALSALFDEALRHLEPKEPAQGTAPSQDGFLYSGNRHESVPRALFLDRRLTPLERNAWQVFRLQLNDDGVTAFPTYDQLRPYLASMPCAASTAHRGEAFDACRHLIDAIKHRVPIWKREFGPDGPYWVGWVDARCGDDVDGHVTQSDALLF